MSLIISQLTQYGYIPDTDNTLLARYLAGDRMLVYNVNTKDLMFSDQHGNGALLFTNPSFATIVQITETLNQ